MAVPLDDVLGRWRFAMDAGDDRGRPQLSVLTPATTELLLRRQIRINPPHRRMIMTMLEKTEIAGKRAANLRESDCENGGTGYQKFDCRDLERSYGC